VSLIPKRDPGIANFSIPDPGIEIQFWDCNHQYRYAAYHITSTGDRHFRFINIDDLE